MDAPPHRSEPRHRRGGGGSTPGGRAEGRGQSLGVTGRSGGQFGILAVQLPKEVPKSVEGSSEKISNVYSEQEVMRSLSDFTANIIGAVGLKEDHTFSNFRILVSTLACLTALYTCRPKQTNGETSEALRIPVALFFGLIGLLMVVEWKFISHTLVVIKDGMGGRVFLDGVLHRSDRTVQFRVRHNDVNITKYEYIGNFYTASGALVESNLYTSIRELLLALQSYLLHGISEGDKKQHSLKTLLAAFEPSFSETRNRTLHITVKPSLPTEDTILQSRSVD